MKIIGVSKFEGEYQGKHFSNYNVYWTDTANVEGERAGSFKVKVDSWNSVMPVSIHSCIGKEIKQIYYDQYKNPVKVEFEDSKALGFK